MYCIGLQLGDGGRKLAAPVARLIEQVARRCAGFLRFRLQPGTDLVRLKLQQPVAGFAGIAFRCPVFQQCVPMLTLSSRARSISGAARLQSAERSLFTRSRILGNKSFDSLQNRRRRPMPLLESRHLRQVLRKRSEPPGRASSRKAAELLHRRWPPDAPVLACCSCKAAISACRTSIKLTLFFAV